MGEALSKAWRAVERHLREAPIRSYIEKEGHTLESTLDAYKANVYKSKGARTTLKLELYHMLEQEFALKGLPGLEARLKYGFYAYVTGLRFTPSDIENQKAVADLRYPVEWYPGTRMLQRRIHLHVGPTNSGKTYHALKSLEAAATGMYAGPLRLLAHEVFMRMNAKGRRTALITGEERRAPDDDPQFDISSCTVEMLDLNKTVDVAVIDEIQMLGSDDRGWAWTQALLGVKAKEVHLCGEARTVPLVQALCAMVGEKPIIHRYKRLSPLEMDKQSLDGDLNKLRKGDCIVSFSVMGIHALRKAIENKTGKKVATVYGGLPPETRAQQARLFNDPDNDYDYLVASDAIGMGLNLSIKRVIFESSVKFDGQKRGTLALADIKQIAGRAGRYKTAQAATDKSEAEEDLSAAKGETVADVNLISESNVTDLVDSAHRYQPSLPPSIYERALSLLHPGADPSNPLEPPPNDPSNIGLVTTLEKMDYPVIQKALGKEPPPIKTAGLLFPGTIVDRFAQYFPPGTPFSYVLLRLSELAQLNTHFHLCGLREALWLADLIEPVRNLTILDRIVFTSTPAGMGDPELWSGIIPALAKCVEQQSGGALYDIAEIPLELLETEVKMDRPYLRQLELLHKAIVVYLWLSYRFAGVFSTRALAQEVKKRVEDRIGNVLEGLSLENKRLELRKRRKADERAARMETMIAGEEDVYFDDQEEGQEGEAGITTEIAGGSDGEVRDEALIEPGGNDEEALTASSDRATKGPDGMSVSDQGPLYKRAAKLVEEAKKNRYNLEDSASTKVSGLGAQLEIPKHLHEAVDTGATEIGKDAISRP
ncbi:ATP-dependent RNA helicase suv3, mitochondrial [Sphaceloma murrayae]|uniref:RNA helicase n=1 Tax=Sphaceloma murrayae TaxID=2082308 RepID=A0A2K1QLM0_9PEZI|nr:ATP-dependent RNA helicase suv3, mitochondrial [Sphaceloma murrayae]